MHNNAANLCLVGQEAAWSSVTSGTSWRSPRRAPSPGPPLDRVSPSRRCGDRSRPRGGAWRPALRARRAHDSSDERRRRPLGSEPRATRSGRAARRARPRDAQRRGRDPSCRRLAAGHSERAGAVPGAIPESVHLVEEGGVRTAGLVERGEATWPWRSGGATISSTGVCYSPSVSWPQCRRCIVSHGRRLPMSSIFSTNAFCCCDRDLVPERCSMVPAALLTYIRESSSKPAILNRCLRWPRLAAVLPSCHLPSGSRVEESAQRHFFRRVHRSACGAGSSGIPGGS